jgi:lipopolysaccharide export system permease protein
MFNFALEKFDKEKLVSKVTASRIKWNPEDSTYTCMITLKER